MSGADDAEWNAAFADAIKDIHGRCDFHEGAEMLRTLVKTKLLRFDDLEGNPERFFRAHRMLLAPRQIPEQSGFGVRFTVQYNLFAGSILSLGDESQREMLNTFQERGVLGCFCLTEAFAGVNSGLVVHTTATWDKSSQRFIITCENAGARKNWISQGLTATHAVVIANLRIDGKFYGPHGFVVEIRNPETGELHAGVSVEDMGVKTTANDLDNARINFDNFSVGREALLRRFADVQDDKYVQTTKDRMRIEILGQRLLTGRLAIAQASCNFGKALFTQTKAYADNKVCWAPKGQAPPKLSEVPHIAAIFREGEEKLDTLSRYAAAVETRLCEVLRTRAIPDLDLVEAIAVAKIQCVQTPITLLNKLVREVGSYALSYDSGFGNIQWLLMCQFAEGDTRILMQKLARDSMKAYQKSSWTDAGKDIVFGTSAEQQEMKVRFQLSRALSAAATPQDAGRLWNENYELVYELANAVCARHISKAIGDESRQVLFAKL